jgi:hypothetical protein
VGSPKALTEPLVTADALGVTLPPKPPSKKKARGAGAEGEGGGPPGCEAS